MISRMSHRSHAASNSRSGYSPGPRSKTPEAEIVPSPARAFRLSSRMAAGPISAAATRVSVWNVEKRRPCPSTDPAMTRSGQEPRTAPSNPQAPDTSQAVVSGSSPKTTRRNSCCTASTSAAEPANPLITKSASPERRVRPSSAPEKAAPAATSCRTTTASSSRATAASKASARSPAAASGCAPAASIVPVASRGSVNGTRRSASRVTRERSVVGVPKAPSRVRDSDASRTVSATSAGFRSAGCRCSTLRVAAPPDTNPSAEDTSNRSGSPWTTPFQSRSGTP